MVIVREIRSPVKDKTTFLVIFYLFYAVYAYIIYKKKTKVMESCERGPVKEPWDLQY